MRYLRQKRKCRMETGSLAMPDSTGESQHIDFAPPGRLMKKVPDRFSAVEGRIRRG